MWCTADLPSDDIGYANAVDRLWSISRPITEGHALLQTIDQLSRTSAWCPRPGSRWNRGLGILICHCMAVCLRFPIMVTNRKLHKSRFNMLLVVWLFFGFSSFVLSSIGFFLGWFALCDLCI